jgi:hypothetical protein
MCVKPVLEPIENDLYDIARRVREYDPALRVYWNRKAERFEVHDLRAIGNTYVLSADRLDARVLQRLYLADLGKRRPADILRDLEEEERRREMRLRAKLSDIALGMYDDLKWAGKVVSGYGGSG